MGHPFLGLIPFRWRFASAPFSKDFNLKAAVLHFVFVLGSSAVALGFDWTPLTPSRFESFTPKGLISERISSILSLPSSLPPPFRTGPFALR